MPPLILDPGPSGNPDGPATSAGRWAPPGLPSSQSPEDLVHVAGRPSRLAREPPLVDEPKRRYREIAALFVGYTEMTIFSTPTLLAQRIDASRSNAALIRR